jgi:hypothetical protein
LLGRGNPQLQTTLQNLQREIEELKQSNMQKDKMIDDLKKEMEHKITHYMLYGQINKQAGQISRLKSELNQGNNTRPGSRGALGEEQVREIIREETKRTTELSRLQHSPRYSSECHPRKYHSTHDNYNKLRKELMK